MGDTERSLRFYRDLLGLRIARESRNDGTEQEHLNNVAGARLRITSLRAAVGPGIEFLEYLAPRDGRPMPADERANDLIHWETILAAPDVEGVAEKLRRARARPVSPGVVRLSQPALGFSRGLLVRDPDGHVLQLVQ